MARRDGRKNNELRDIGLVYEGLDRVDGSARFSFGDFRIFSLVVFSLTILKVVYVL